MSVIAIRRETHLIFFLVLVLLLLAASSAGATFYYSVDIGSDLEYSDPYAWMIPPQSNNEYMDPAKIYTPDPTGGNQAQEVKSDLLIFGQAPLPEPGNPVPVAPNDVQSPQLYFDMDGEDQLDIIPADYDPQEGLLGPVVIPPMPAVGLLYNPNLLYFSMDDDGPPGWWDVSINVPVVVAPDRGSAAGKNEILRSVGWRNWPASISPVTDETGLTLAPNPLPVANDDDVDALDTRVYRYWYWTCDHEAHYNLDPGAIYLTDTLNPPDRHLYISRALLGLQAGTDIDAFEFCVTDDSDILQQFGLAAGSYLAVVFSVDQDDPTTLANESGGLYYGTVYISLLNYSAPVALAAFDGGDLDAIAFEEEEEPPVETAKWIQRPDLAETGVDVCGTLPRLLADDFRCTTNQAITRIVIWASWRYDEMPNDGDPGSVDFKLSIHSDIPAAQSPNGYSEPAEPALWTYGFSAGDYTVEIEAADIDEYWYYPDLEIPTVIFPGDHICWKYTFDVPLQEAFVQTGAVDNAIVYWLDAQVVSDIAPLYYWGWKSSLDHWNDDAVWADGIDGSHGPWIELRYWDGHQLYPDSMDLAFALYGTDVPEEDLFDWGDAPDGAAAPGYPTLATHNGAHHMIGGPYLGTTTDAPDPEGDGQPDPNAMGDDNDGNDDENGVVFTSALIPGQVATVDVTASAACRLDAWLDFGADNSWAEAGDQIFTAKSLVAGVNNLSFFVPSTAVLGMTFARFRCSSYGGLSFIGQATDGEVEDYEVPIEELPVPKWVQLPDLSPLGMDVNAVLDRPCLLADDFLCTHRSTITNIVVWGSWIYDVLPLNDPDNVVFQLSIHADIPASQNPDGYSMPGEILWLETFTPGMFNVQVEADGLIEGWYDPVQQFYDPFGDSICWRYEFPIDVLRAFVQTGTVDNPIVYWLDVQADPLDEQGAQFGWKTTQDHWNDDACWVAALEPFVGVWNELRYPIGHEMQTQSVDLAFALYGGEVEEEELYDWGDAPDAVGAMSYPTLAINNGANHLIAGPWFGDASDVPDAEPDGQPDPIAARDDSDGNDDEDGFNFPSMVAGTTQYVPFVVNGAPSGGAVVEIWIDWNQNSSWTDAVDKFYSFTLSNGTYSFPVQVPNWVPAGTTFARCRISTSGTGTPSGPAPDGEVEDHAITVERLYDFGDAPDRPYPTLSINNGAMHIVGGPWFGDASDIPDVDADGQPNATATGDDADGNDDEDGLSVPAMTVGIPANISFTVNGASSVGAVVEFWIDWNINGGWTESDEYYNGVFTNGTYTVAITPPFTAVAGTSFLRARISSTGVGVPDGLALDGEVEDHSFTIERKFDFGDAPDRNYLTLAASGGASHVITGPWLGDATDSPDVDADGQPTAGADGDDNDGNDDENGVALPAYIRQDRTETITVTVSGACKLNAWIDFNIDADWGESNEQIFTDLALTAGSTNLSFYVPLHAKTGTTYMRFRVSTAGGDNIGGPSADGEVEDYTIDILEKFPPALGLKWLQKPDCRYGLNLGSWMALDQAGTIYESPVVAEDWWCDGRPINAIRWWGSYILYGGSVTSLSVNRPTGFRLKWYLDIPASTDGTMPSMPGRVLRKQTVPLLPYQTAAQNKDEVSEKYICTVPLDFLGTEFAGLREHKFEYEVVLQKPWMEKNTLSREGYEPPCSSNVYWISIEAVYDTPPDPASDYVWGWETTCKRFNWNDAAVVATNTPAGTNTPWNAMSYIPQLWPWTAAVDHPYLGERVNMAFAMLSEVVGRRDTKWSQLPNMIYGTDMPSWRYVDPSMPAPPWSQTALRADDFISDGRRITDIHWWGSYIGWQGAYYGDEFDPIVAPLSIDERPLGFDLSWHAHDPTSGQPGTVLTNIFIPMARCHEMYYCTVEQLRYNPLSPYLFEHEYQYYVDLLDERLENLPWLEQQGEHYWLNIQAVFATNFIPAVEGEAGSNYPHEGWGWKIAGIAEADPIRLEPSVVSTNYVPIATWNTSYLPWWHNFAYFPHDLAFELTTDQPDTNEVINIVSIDVDLTTNEVYVGSVGTGNAGVQVLQKAGALKPSITWSDVETNAVPFPYPSVNTWLRMAAPSSNEFYRVIEFTP